MTTKFLPTILLERERVRGECPHLFTIDDKESLSELSSTLSVSLLSILPTQEWDTLQWDLISK